MKTLTRRDFLKVAGLSTAAISAMALAACGGKGETGTPSTSEPSGNKPATAPVSDGTTQSVTMEQAAAKEETWTEADADKTVVYHMGSTAHTLQKWTATGGDFLGSQMYCVYDGPIWVNPENFEFENYLATDYQLSDDYLTCDVTIRDDVYFTNGVHMTAHDLWWAMENLRASEYYPDGIVKAWRPYLDSIEETGEYSIRIKFTKPMPAFVANFGASLQIMPVETIESMGWDAYWQCPVGSGPYTYDEVDLTNSKVTLKLREDENGYWGYRKTGYYTNVKYLTFENSPEETTRIASLKTGEVDIIDNVPTSELGNLSGIDSISVNVLPSANQVFLQLACGAGDAFENKDLCRALNYAIDRELLVSSLMDGFAVPSTCGAQPGYYGYEDAPKYEYNLDKAKEFLQKANYDGREFRLVYTLSTVSNGNEVAQALQMMWQEAGINVKLEPLDVSLYDAARDARDFDIVLANIGASAPYQRLTYPEVIGNDKFNTGYQNEELRGLCQELQITVSPEKQTELLGRIFEIEADECQPNLYLYAPQKIFACQKNVTNILNHNATVLDCHAIVVND